MAQHDAINAAQGREDKREQIAPWLQRHIYLSEACIHEACDQCPGFCAFCDEECLCPHHHLARQEKENRSDG